MLSANPKPTVLVLAHEGLFRDSLEFLLGAEGLRSIVSSDWQRATAGDFDCVIIDEHLLGKTFDGAQCLDTLGTQVVLLSSHTHPIPSLPRVRRVSKPLRGSGLVDEIRHAISEHARHLRRNT